MLSQKSGRGGNIYPPASRGLIVYKCNAYCNPCLWRNTVSKHHASLAPLVLQKSSSPGERHLYQRVMNEDRFLQLSTAPERTCCAPPRPTRSSTTTSAWCSPGSERGPATCCRCRTTATTAAWRPTTSSSERGSANSSTEWTICKSVFVYCARRVTKPSYLHWPRLRSLYSLLLNNSWQKVIFFWSWIFSCIVYEVQIIPVKYNEHSLCLYLNCK